MLSPTENAECYVTGLLYKVLFEESRYMKRFLKTYTFYMELNPHIWRQQRTWDTGTLITYVHMPTIRTIPKRQNVPKKDVTKLAVD